MHQFKYEGKRHLRFILAGWMAEGLGDPRLRAPPPEVLVPVPLHWSRQFARGFNQAELLAHALAELSPGLRPYERAHSERALRLPVERMLRRVRDTGTQTVLSRGERLGNLRGAFALGRGALGRGAGVSGRHVLLVDDVLTTGATLDACARVLLSAGAASVTAGAASVGAGAASVTAGAASVGAGAASVTAGAASVAACSVVPAVSAAGAGGSFADLFLTTS